MNRMKKKKERWLSVKKQLGESSNVICDSLLQLIPERKLKSWRQNPEIDKEIDKDIEAIPTVPCSQSLKGLDRTVMKPENKVPNNTVSISRLSHYIDDNTNNIHRLSHCSSIDSGDNEIKQEMPPPKPHSFHNNVVLVDSDCEIPGVDDNELLSVSVPGKHEGDDDSKVKPAAEDPENKEKDVNDVEKVATRKDTYGVMLESAKYSDLKSLGARPKVKQKFPASDLVEEDTDHKEPVKKNDKSRDTISKFERLVKDDKKNCQEVKKHANKNVKTEVNSRESGQISVVKSCQLIKEGLVENATKSEDDELNKFNPSSGKD